MFVELLSEKSLKKNLLYMGKDEKKFRTSRFLFAAIFLLWAAGIVYVSKDFFLIPLIPMAAFIGYKYPYFNVLRSRNNILSLNSQLFPGFLTTFNALLPTSGNVYQALVACIPYTKDPLRSSLEGLVRKVEDANRREDYMLFAEHIGTSEAYMMMDMIYQFSEYGIQRESLMEMQRFAQELDKNKMNELIQSKMVKMEALGYIPVFISMFLVLCFAGTIGWHYVKYVMDILSMQ
ncbi:hypothetical protein [Pseudobacillus badius]|uniref:hypothetical protein n=1 Tax=Bacillus badius TaxID=1455 RepID=UPI001CC0AD9A|nr:hypothetical protein [Bacillus badius]UAT32407.1 hypothetical protein K7T73_09440 [Bacillus badius]GLY12880.1 hypothetical protein Bbad01_40960 [Bacillus badius]